MNAVTTFAKRETSFIAFPKSGTGLLPLLSSISSTHWHQKIDGGLTARPRNLLRDRRKRKRHLSRQPAVVLLLRATSEVRRPLYGSRIPAKELEASGAVVVADAGQPTLFE